MNPQYFSPQAEMAKRNSVGSHDMPRNTAFRPAYGTAQDSDDVSHDNPKLTQVIFRVVKILDFCKSFAYKY